MRAAVFHSRMAPHRPGSNHVDLEAARRERDLRHALALDLRRQCEDAGISQAALARAAHLSTAQVSRLLSARESPSLRGLIALSVALDARIILRIDPVTGPRIHDRVQAPIVEALLRIIHPRWRRFLEVAVHRPARGVIDVVLHDPDAGDVIAAEIESRIRRFEQQQRWANAKADSLLIGSELPLASVPGRAPTVSRLLILASSRANRDLVSTLSTSFATSYPGRTADAYRALTTADAPWPGSSLLWARVEGTSTEILAAPPRSVAFGR